MRAVVITEPGAPEVLRLSDVPDPAPGPGEIRVRVEAAGVNRADLLQRRGQYAAPEGWPADIPGLEYAGVVDGVGERVSVWSEGDRVMGLVGGGAYAEYVVVPADEALPVPDALDAVSAAAVPEAFITAQDALRTRVGLRSGESVLIHAVGSSVGTAALQLAQAYGARVIGTSRTPWKLERAAELGLETPIRPEDGSFASEVRAATRGGGVQAILELVGGAYLAEDLKCIDELGRIILVGLTAGRFAELDLALLLRRRVTLVGTVMRSRSTPERVATARAFAEDGLPHLARGRARPVIHEVVPMAEAARAHTLLEDNATFGSVVLSW